MFKFLDIGQIINNARVEKRITMREISKVVGSKPSQISAFECGREAPTDDMLKKICGVLDLDFAEMQKLNTAEYKQQCEAKMAEEKEHMRKVGELFVEVMKLSKSTKQNVGTIGCKFCAGVIEWSRSDYNGHIWMRCLTCGFGVMQ